MGWLESSQVTAREESLLASLRSKEIQTAAAFQLSGIYANFKISVRITGRMQPIIRKPEYVTWTSLITDSSLMGQDFIGITVTHCPLINSSDT